MQNRWASTNPKDCVVLILMAKHYKFTFLVAFVCGLLWIGTLFGLSGGAAPGYNGTNFEGGSVVTRDCLACHSITGAPGGSATTVNLSGLPVEWTPGTDYPLTVTVTNAAVSRFGFQLSAVVDATSTQPASGVLSAISGNVGVLTGANGVVYADQISTGSGTFNVNWRSPSSASVGAIRFNLVGLGAAGPVGQTGADTIGAIAPVVSPECHRHWRYHASREAKYP